MTERVDIPWCIFEKKAKVQIEVSRQKKYFFFGKFLRKTGKKGAFLDTVTSILYSTNQGFLSTISMDYTVYDYISASSLTNWNIFDEDTFYITFNSFRC